jgi:hypothetical protein
MASSRTSPAERIKAAKCNTSAHWPRRLAALRAALLAWANDRVDVARIHTIPERRDQRARRATLLGHPLAFNKAIYVRRNVVEIVCTQMTKTDVLAGGRRRNHLADLDIAVRDDHAIDEQFN